MDERRMTWDELASENSKLKGRVQELEEALDQCMVYIKTGNHKCLDMPFIIKVLESKDGQS